LASASPTSFISQGRIRTSPAPSNRAPAASIRLVSRSSGSTVARQSRARSAGAVARSIAAPARSQRPGAAAMSAGRWRWYDTIRRRNRVTVGSSSASTFRRDIGSGGISTSSGIRPKACSLARRTSPPTPSAEPAAMARLRLR
jgi:hypothetical protein